MAPWRTAGDISTGQQPQPFEGGLFLRSGWLGLVEQVSTLASRLRRAAVGHKADMAQALQAVGHHMQEKAADELVCWQGHELDAITLASVAEGKAHLATLAIDEPVVGESHAVGVASEIGEHLPRSCHGLLGIDHPRLVIERVDEALKALGGFEGCHLLSQHQGLPAVVEGSEELPAEDRAQGMHGKQETRLGGHPACALVGQGTAWYQRVHVEMGIERLIPGVQEQQAAELAAQVVVAKLQEWLAGGSKQQGEKGAFVGEDEGGEVMREGKDAVEIRDLTEVDLSILAPLVLAEGLALGAVAIATRVVGRALEAILPTLFSASPEFSGATDQDVVHALLMRWWHGVRLTVGGAIES